MAERDNKGIEELRGQKPRKRGGQHANRRPAGGNESQAKGRLDTPNLPAVTLPLGESGGGGQSGGARRGGSPSPSAGQQSRRPSHAPQRQAGGGQQQPEGGASQDSQPEGEAPGQNLPDTQRNRQPQRKDNQNRQDQQKQQREPANKTEKGLQREGKGSPTGKAGAREAKATEAKAGAGRLAGGAAKSGSTAARGAATAAKGVGGAVRGIAAAAATVEVWGPALLVVLAAILIFVIAMAIINPGVAGGNTKKGLPAAVDGGAVSCEKPSGTPKEIVDEQVLPIAHKIAFKEITAKTVKEANDRHGPTVNGGRSDHQGPPERAWAADISNGGSPTPEMDKLAKDLSECFGITWKGSGMASGTKNGYNFQLIYRCNPCGGNHMNHVHIGVSKGG